MLKARLEAWFAEHVDPALDGARRRITGCGQLGRVPPDGDGRDAFADEPVAPLTVPVRERPELADLIRSRQEDAR